jgi:hypothetical protein
VEKRQKDSEQVKKDKKKISHELYIDEGFVNGFF